MNVAIKEQSSEAESWISRFTDQANLHFCFLICKMGIVLLIVLLRELDKI